MNEEQYVIQLQDGRYWIDWQNTTGNIHAASKYSSRWIALTEMSKAGIKIMANAKIVGYKPSTQERNL